MDKLEEQLRASRRREVPDLTPPAGGWEAVSAQLAAGAGAAGAAASAVEQAAAGTGAGATTATVAGKAGLLLWLKSLIGLGSVLLMGGALTWFVTADDGATAKNTTDADRATTTSSVIPTGDDGAVDEVATTAGYQGEEIDNSAAGADARLTEQSASVAPVTPAAETALPAKAAATSRALNDGISVAPPVKVAPPAPPVSPPGDVPPAVKAPMKSGIPFAANSAAPASPPNMEAPGEEAGIIDPFATPAPTSEDIAPVRETIAATAPLNPGLYFIEGNDPTMGLSPPAIKSAPPRLRRNGRPKAPAFWQVHGTAGYYGYESGRLARYFTQDAAGELQFISPDGEIRSFTPRGFNSDDTRFNYDFWSLRAGISRQTSSGFLFRSSLMLYQQQLRVDEGNTRPPGTNEIRLDSEEREFAVIGQLGLQYTFLKRHRLRPWVGVGLMTFLYSNVRSTDVIVDGASGLSVAVNQINSTRYLPLTANLTLSVGLQYQINNRWSAGAMLWSGADNYIFVEAPVNLEVRYSLFK